MERSARCRSSTTSTTGARRAARSTTAASSPSISTRPAGPSARSSRDSAAAHSRPSAPRVRDCSRSADTTGQNGGASAMSSARPDSTTAPPLVAVRPNSDTTGSCRPPRRRRGARPRPRRRRRHAARRRAGPAPRLGRGTPRPGSPSRPATIVTVSSPFQGSRGDGAPGEQDRQPGVDAGVGLAGPAVPTGAAGRRTRRPRCGRRRRVRRRRTGPAPARRRRALATPRAARTPSPDTVTPGHSSGHRRWLQARRHDPATSITTLPTAPPDRRCATAPGASSRDTARSTVARTWPSPIRPRTGVSAAATGARSSRCGTRRWSPMQAELRKDGVSRTAGNAR